MGAVRLASQGTVLAEAKTRTFEVFTLNQYTAVRMSILILLLYTDANQTMSSFPCQAPTRLTQCFLRQGARMFTYMPLTS